MNPRALSLIVLTFACLLGNCAAEGAEDLRLRDGISFYQDIDVGFPIVAEKMDDLKVEPGRPAFIFFGASGDLNTSRQARRVVDLYRRNRSSGVKFIIVDVDQSSNPQTQDLVRKHYTGYIPFELIVRPDGKVAWSQIGEVDSRVLQNKLEAVIER